MTDIKQYTKEEIAQIEQAINDELRAKQIERSNEIKSESKATR